MQRRIVHHGESGKAREVRPDEIVAARVAELVDDEIVRRTEMSPDEIMRARLIEAIDRKFALEPRQQLGVDLGDPGTHRRQRREPGETHQPDHLSVC